MSQAEIRPFVQADHAWAAALLTESWGSSRSVSRGRVHDVDKLPGFVAWLDGERVGLVTYHQDGDECEIVTLNSLKERCGVGIALLDAVRRVAADQGCRRLWLITTNDNLAALGFYQRRGYRLVAVHCNALEESRRLKPQIPQIGLDGIPLRDEIELELEI